ncbi:MAG: universal stress protein [Candidatus Tectomicrobia bacterium]|uniref:Universal stress protein n=1 Tax=Tectimicrobiota bacterium TaxID=2528274 RepID=A0A937W2Y2_UNCTE|nr:universal stress protein [Candidatus Tectomicrobia bacterium]
MAFTHVLVPTDFSETAMQALCYALEEATAHGARVTLLHIMPPHTSTDVYYITGAPGTQPGFDPVLGGRLVSPAPAAPTVVRHDHHEEAITHLQDLMPDSFHGTWEVAVATGHPAETIVRIAQERAADLIVMGTHGRTGLQHALLGSVTEKVVRLASCPVLTIRQHTSHADK